MQSGTMKNGDLQAWETEAELDVFQFIISCGILYLPALHCLDFQIMFGIGTSTR